MSTPHTEQNFESDAEADDDRARRDRAWAAIESAESAPDAGEVLTRGEWVGFTKANAIAWAWNLVQYEPRGFLGPMQQMRMEYEADLARGRVPKGLRYAQRARELEADGLAAREYRRAKEREGARTFTQEDVVTTYTSVDPRRRFDSQRSVESPQNAEPQQSREACGWCCVHAPSAAGSGRGI